MVGLEKIIHNGGMIVIHKISKVTGKFKLFLRPVKRALQ